MIGAYSINRHKALIYLRFNLGGQGTAPTVAGYLNIWGEPNPTDTAGDIDKTDYPSWGDLGRTGIDFVANNGASADNRWGLFGGNSYGNTGETSSTNQLYPANVILHLWFVNGASKNVTCQLTNVPSGTYTVRLMGSRDDGVGGTRISTFQVNSASTQNLECIGNTGNDVSFTGVTPSAGVITIRLQRNNNNFAYINSIILQQTA